MAVSARLISRSLAGYLCGTHSGALSRRRGDRLATEQIPAAHRALPRTAGQAGVLGASRWEPQGRAATLARALSDALASEGIRDLIVFGSQARGAATAFSDLDAILVIDDELAEDARGLERLRAGVLGAQRAVLAWQPMQHHGFEVVSPRLLAQAGEALAMPAVALSESRSLRGVGSAMTFSEADGVGDREPLLRLAADIAAIEAWPRHPWKLHRAVSICELLPTVWLQARGEAVPKWRSFELARSELGDAWWPYEVLERVRSEWPQLRAPALGLSARALRNPWLAVEAWRRAPVMRPLEITGLDGECLAALQRLAQTMLERPG